ncbi:MAG: hypothetical protein HY326_00475 [Chloroflexi bacterium]|nr:hypothetical protein [Chloroflexota bacterium]
MVATAIPRKIHYCWFGDSAQPPIIHRCIESWKRLLPDYEIKKWSEANLPMNSPYVRTVYQWGLWPKVANFVRLHALTTEGGIYLDTDVEILRKFDPLLQDGCFLGFQQRHKNSDWVNNAVMGAVPGHPYVKRCLDLIQSTFERNGKIFRGPESTTLVLRELGLSRYGLQVIGGVRLYPHEYFYPYPWWANFHPVRVKSQTYAIHHWQHAAYDMSKFPTRLKAQRLAYDIISEVLALEGAIARTASRIRREPP